MVENEQLAEPNDHDLGVIIVIEVPDRAVAVAVERTATARIARRVLVRPAFAAVVVVDGVPRDHFLQAIPIEVGDRRDRSLEPVVSDTEIHAGRHERERAPVPGERIGG